MVGVTYGLYGLGLLMLWPTLIGVLIALLGLTIRPSSEITLAADGPDADEALAALAAELAPYVSPAG